MENNGTECNILSQEIMVAFSWNSQGILVHTSLLKQAETFFPLTTVAMEIAKEIFLEFRGSHNQEKKSSVHFTKLNITQLLKKIGQMEKYFSRKNVAKLGILRNHATKLIKLQI